MTTVSLGVKDTLAKMLDAVPAKKRQFLQASVAYPSERNLNQPPRMWSSSTAVSVNRIKHKQAMATIHQSKSTLETASSIACRGRALTSMRRRIFQAPRCLAREWQIALTCRCRKVWRPYKYRYELVLRRTAVEKVVGMATIRSCDVASRAGHSLSPAAIFAG